WVAPTTPKAATTSVSAPATSSPSQAKSASGPASAPNSSVYTRSTAYRPTLVMMVNSAATAAGAREYASGSQIYSGSSAALPQNTTSSSPAAAFTMATSSGAVWVTRTAI